MHFLSCTHMMPACYNSHLLCTVHCVFPWLRTLSSSTCVRAMEKACIWPRGDFPFISFLSLQTTWTSWDQDICSLKNRGNSFDKRVWFYVVFIASTPRIQMTKANKQLYNNKDHLGRGCRTKCSQNAGIAKIVHILSDRMVTQVFDSGKQIIDSSQCSGCTKR